MQLIRVFLVCICTAPRLALLGALMLTLLAPSQALAQQSLPGFSPAESLRLVAERDQQIAETGDKMRIDAIFAEYLKMCQTLKAIGLNETSILGETTSRFSQMKVTSSTDNADDGPLSCVFSVPDSLFFCPGSNFATSGCATVKLPIDWVVALGIQKEVNGICPAGEVGMTALKAQAVLWATYGIKRNLEGKPANTGQAVALTSTPNLRCFLTAQLTHGQVLLGSDPDGHDYGKLIFAAYNARCNGNKTRSAHNGVWHNTGTCSEGGAHVSYLQSVICANHDNCDGTSETPCCATNDGESIYGHGVGACQRGIVEFAKQGWNYEQILLHYFSNKVCITPTTACTLTANSPLKANGCGEVILTAQVPTAGKAPFSYLWSTSDTGLVIRVPTVATYSVTITDAQQCTIAREVKVTNIPKGNLRVSISTAINTGCAKVITATPSGEPGPYSYQWSTGSESNSLAVNISGMYTVTVTANGNAECTVSKSANITVKPLTATATVQALDDCATAPKTGKVKLAVTGANGSWTALWSDGVTTTASVRSNMLGALYSVTVTGINGCTAIIDNIDTRGNNCNPVTLHIVDGKCNTLFIEPMVPAGTTLTDCKWISQSSNLTSYSHRVYVWFPGDYVLSAKANSIPISITQTISDQVWGLYNPFPTVSFSSGSPDYAPCKPLTLNNSRVASIVWPWLGTEQFIVDDYGPASNAGLLPDSIRKPGEHSFTVVYSNGCEETSTYTIGTLPSMSTVIPIVREEYGAADSLYADLTAMGIPDTFGQLYYRWIVRDTTTNWLMYDYEETTTARAVRAPITITGNYKLTVKGECDEQYTLFGEHVVNTLHNEAQNRDSQIASEQMTSKNPLTISPNPATSYCTITGVHGIGSVTSPQGIIVREFATESADTPARIELAGLNPGVYIITVCDVHGIMHTKKLAILK